MKTKLNLGILTMIVIGVLVMSIVVMGFSMLITDLGTHYNTSDEVANLTASIEQFNYTSSLKNKTFDVKDQTDVQQREGFFDIIGGYFGQGYAALKDALTSVKVIFGSGSNEGLLQKAVNEAPVLQPAGLLVNNLGAIIMIIVTLGVMVASILKWKV